MRGLSLDLRYGLRALVRRPAFLISVVLILALGIGANTSIFTVVNALLIRPLPYAQPERLVKVWETVDRDTVERREFSFPDYRDLAERATAFAGLAAYAESGAILSGVDRAERLDIEVVTPTYFAVLGARPALGRTFRDDGTPDEVVLSDGLWRRRFGADPEVLGRTIQLDRRPMTVVGVMAPGFRALERGVELWSPLSSLPESYLTARGARWHQVVARLAPGVGLEGARQQVKAVFADLEREHPDSNAHYGGTVIALREELFGDLRPALAVLLAAVGFVLLIACANVANLVSIRAVGRRREAAVRAALGTGRGRLLMLYAVEATLLSAAAAGLGLLAGLWGLDALRAFNPVALPDFVTFDLDWRVIAFTVAAAAFTGLVPSLVELIHGGERSLSEDLREGGRQGSGGRRSQRTWRLLVVAEVALAMTLTVAAGLMIQSLGRLRGIDPGFDSAGLLFFRLDLPEPEGSAGDAPPPVLDRQVLDALGSLPGVTAVAHASDSPLEGSSSATVVSPEGWLPRGDAPYGGAMRVYRHRVSPGFFSTLGVPLVAGRDFANDDLAADPPEAVIVSEEMARRAWPGEDPVGKRLQSGRPGGDGIWFTVVGVARDVHYRNLAPPGPGVPDDPDLYFPLDPARASGPAVAVRSALPPAAVAASLRAAIAGLDPEVALFSFESMDERIVEQSAEPRFSTVILGVFAALALVLAGAGLYSVLAYVVSRRTREIGIRMALGAHRATVLRQVVGEGMALVGTGVALGLALALALSRLLAGSLYQVSPVEPSAYALVIVVMAGVGLAACLLPARRASRLNPADTIRAD